VCLTGSSPVQRLPLLEADRNLPVPAQIDNFLNTRTARPLGDQYSIDNTARLQGFTNRVDPDKNTHNVDVSVTVFACFYRVIYPEMSTTRRTAITTLLGLGSGTAVYGSALNREAWRAYQAVEEAWIRERHALLIEQCPDCSEAASIDLELKLAELHRRAMQFEYLSKHRRDQLRGGMWQLSWLPMSGADAIRLNQTSTAYRHNEETIRKLTGDLRKHATYNEFRKAQTRLWKTPDYRFVHRRYSGRLQELNKEYGLTTGSL
jgi:hypothetical protein